MGTDRGVGQTFLKLYVSKREGASRHGHGYGHAHMCRKLAHTLQPCSGRNFFHKHHKTRTDRTMVRPLGIWNGGVNGAGAAQHAEIIIYSCELRMPELHSDFFLPLALARAFFPEPTLKSLELWH